MSSVVRVLVVGAGIPSRWRDAIMSSDGMKYEILNVPEGAVGRHPNLVHIDVLNDLMNPKFPSELSLGFIPSEAFTVRAVVPPRQAHGPQRKGRGGKIRRW